jgi:hypothetical protein
MGFYMYRLSALVIFFDYGECLKCCFALIQVKENPAALLALSWYWATEGVGNKVCSFMGYDFS